MITQIKQVIQEHPEWLKSPHTPLSFMKFSTPASGIKLDKQKVHLFVFEQGEILPTLCVKTTRTYSVGDVIKRNYENLKLLEDGVRGTEFAQMFAVPLYLYDNAGLIFCIESVCPGVILSAQTRGAELVIEKYIAWQSHLARKTKGFLELEHGIRLPILVQHGDMTPNNVLVSGRDIHLVDYDYVGIDKLAGFDLFNFLSKIKLRPETLNSCYERYFPHYLKSIGAHVESYKALFPLYHRVEVIRKTKKI
ncbi:MAG: hypothetical protein HYT68_01105 [Candidatus Zambryskibacteria bacterium]|nr:hypothetical protein [Candidatus Zambryskibacteria bacterium]